MHTAIAAADARTSFSGAMRMASVRDWDAVLGHPFLQGMRDGSLPIDAFRRYMVQDYLFLVEYARVLALAVAKAPGLDGMGRLAELLHATLNVEMELHRGFAGRVGIGRAELEGAEMLPACHAYTSHLLAVAWGQPPSVIAASLLPCQLGYAEIAQRLAELGMPPVPEFAEWVRAYVADEYVSLARWLALYADHFGAQANITERAAMEAAYRASLRYEHGFWDMALGGQGDA
jgi:thiaminase/transcriptional activator TenA